MTQVLHSIIREMMMDHTWNQKYLLYSANMQASLEEDNKVYDPIPEIDRTKLAQNTQLQTLIEARSTNET